TFLVSGLWHGASWTFVVWGALHGVYLVLGHTMTPARTWLAAMARVERWPTGLATVRLVWTFTLVCLAWSFFRADSAADAIVLLSNMTRFDGVTPWHLANPDIHRHLLMGGVGLVVMEDRKSVV